MLITRLFLGIQIISFWPVWYWYGLRMLDGSDEPWGVLALATLLIIVSRKGINHSLSTQTVVICSLIVAIYITGYGILPPLFKGILAVTALAFSISQVCYGRAIAASILGLMLLSLPLIATLQYYGGFPIRLITAYSSSQILCFFGYPVQPQGTLLYWLGEVIAVDAPCAGIKMMWTGLYLNFTLAAWRNLGLLATWLRTSFTLFSVFIANIIRATLLFFTESGLLDAPDIAHQAIGIAIFTLVALAILKIHAVNFQHHNKEYQPCI